MTKYGYETSDGSTYKLLLHNAKSNRRNMTAAEVVLWECLRGNSLGVRFRRQHPIADYIPDFVCLKKRLVIEVDGGYHFIDQQMASDAERTSYLNQKGFDVLRFTNEEVLGNIDGVLNSIKSVIAKKEDYMAQTTLNIPSSTAQDSLDSVQASSVSSQASLGSTQASSVPVGTPLLRRGRGRLIIFSAPSGSGKSTIVNWLMQEHPELKLYFSISCTSRQPRGTEQNGVEYFFLTPEEFKEKIAANEFLEYEEVYANRFYGTLKQQVERQREQGQNVVFDVDVKGGVNIKRYYGDEALSLFIQPPSVDELRRRLVGRATDTPEAIEQRLAKAEYELTFAPQFDHIIVNDDLETAKQQTLRVVEEFLGISK